MAKPKETFFHLPNGEVVKAGDHVDVLFTKKVYPDEPLVLPPAINFDFGQLVEVKAWIKGFYVFDFYYFTEKGVQNKVKLSAKRKRAFYSALLIPLYRKVSTRLMPKGRNTFQSAAIAYNRTLVRRHKPDAIDFSEFYLVNKEEADSSKFKGYVSFPDMNWDEYDPFNFNS